MDDSNSNQFLNRQVTDSMTQTSAHVLGESPAQALGTLYQMVTHANGLALQNAVSNQQNLNQLNAVIVADAIKLLKG